ncbi:MAG: FmdE family protein [Desulfotomaculales bacterium]
MDAWSDAVKLHGHACCLLAVGYRAARAAMARLGVTDPEHEGLLAVVGNNTCAVDAVQAVCRCTAGNRNLVVRPTGKYVLVLGRLGTDAGVRVSVRPGILTRPGPDFVALMEEVANGTAGAEARAEFYRRQQPLMDYLLNAADEELFLITPARGPFRRAPLVLSMRVCADCGEETTEEYARMHRERWLCPECWEKAVK